MQFLLKVSGAILADALTVVPQHQAATDRWFTLVEASLFVLGLTCDAYLAAQFVKVTRDQGSNASLFKVGPKFWGLDELLMAGGAFVGLVLITNSFYGFAAWFSHHAPEDLAPLIIFTELLLRLAILIGFVIFFHRRRIDIDTALGLRNMAPLQALAWGIVFGFASVPPVRMLIAASDALCHALGLHPSEQPIAELFANTSSSILLALLALFAVVIAPIFEEFMFRGFAYPALKQRFGTWRGLAIVSGAFAISHVHLPSLVPLFFLAIGLALAYEWTGSLLAPIAMHALFNAVTVVPLILLRVQS